MCWVFFHNVYAELLYLRLNHESYKHAVQDSSELVSRLIRNKVIDPECVKLKTAFPKLVRRIT